MKVVAVPVHNWFDRTSSPGGPGTAAKSQTLSGVPKVPSLLFDIELEETKTEQRVTESTPRPVLTQVAHLVTPRTDLERLVMNQWAFRADTGGDVATALAALAECLVSQGHSASVQTTLGGGGGGSCLRNLRHTFLSYQGRGLSPNKHSIFDPAFREQFEIANPSQHYTHVLAAVPAAFVGSEENLVQLVRLLCKEMQAEFEARGTAPPPWRDVQAMLSKWKCDSRTRRDLRQHRSGARTPLGAGLLQNQHPPPLLHYLMTDEKSGNASALITGAQRSFLPAGS